MPYTVTVTDPRADNQVVAVVTVETDEDLRRVKRAYSDEMLDCTVTSA